MSATPTAEAAPVTALTVRACCLILHDGQVALIHRQRPDGDQYSVPGGVVHADEDVAAALARELDEELGLDVTGLTHPPELRWVQDQMTTRPGTTTLFRRLHLIHVLDLPSRARQSMAETELDAEDYARVIWTPLGRSAALHLYPAVGPAINGLARSHGEAGPVLLPSITDENYNWR